MSRKIILAAIILIALASMALAETITVESTRVTVRSGAGNYYQAVADVIKGAQLTVIKHEGTWILVKLPDGKEGYVSSNALTRRPTASDQAWLKDKGVGAASTSQVMAATKGVSEESSFIRKYASSHNLKPASIDEISTVPFTSNEYAEFRDALSPRENPRANLSLDGIPETDRQIGAAVAMRLAALGLSDDKRLNKYVAMVGTAIVDQTPVADQPFYFIVLDSPKVQSFSAPGGYVFITTGAIKIMKNEAELAGVLSHEIIHVIERHGIREMTAQKERIHSSEAMDSLDSEMDKMGVVNPFQAEEDDLNEMADMMYERLIGGRKQVAEDEADRLGTVLLADAGYRADGLREFIIGLAPLGEEPVMSHRSIADRVRIIDKVISRNNLSLSAPALQGRFEKYAK